MEFIWWCFAIAVFAILLFLLISYICFRRVFYFKAQKPSSEDDYGASKWNIKDEYREHLISIIKAARETPHENIYIQAFDGIKLHGRYYEYKPSASLELIFHGYKGNSDKDFSGGIERCFALGRNVLLIDQRAGGKSGGHTVSFGINERKDCKKWVDYAVNRFGADVKIYITGVSMGAATVIMATEENLPDNVKLVTADCGYSSPKGILLKVIDEMKLPVKTLYPFVKAGARIFGRFDLEEASPIEAARKCKIPIIFIHGDSDTYVPFEMSKAMFDNCYSEKKRLVKIQGAGHAFSYLVASEQYIKALREAEKEWNI